LQIKEIFLLRWVSGGFGRWLGAVGSFEIGFGLNAAIRHHRRIEVALREAAVQASFLAA
jgi:hypothetical protein